MTSKPWNSDRHRAWQLFQRVSAQLGEQLDHELQQHHELALIDYQILSELSRAPGHRLRMSELADLVLVSRSRLTYRIDRLVAVDHVRREECEDDRRGMWAIATDTGRRAHAAAKPDHEGAVDAWFFDQMSVEELKTCSQIMARVADKLSDRSDSRT